MDASEYAYAAVGYIRIQMGETVHVALVASKSKVAPHNPLSIPRMELKLIIGRIRKQFYTG